MTARPLVALTRDDGPDGRFAAALAARGLAPFALPTIAIRPCADRAYLDATLAELTRADWLVFTSAHAVAAVIERPAWRGLGGARPRIAAVGDATAARLRESGAPPDLVADEPGARGLAAALSRSRSLDGIRVVWPRSDRARPELAERLRACGARVSELVAYRSEPIVAGPRLAEFQRLLGAGSLAAIAFLSPSSAIGLATALGMSDLGHLAGRALVASIGPTTSTALRALHAPPQIEASRPALDSLADALAASLTGAKS